MKMIAINKSASFEYFLIDKYEAGIVLEGLMFRKQFSIKII